MRSSRRGKRLEFFKIRRTSHFTKSTCGNYFLFKYVSAYSSIEYRLSNLNFQILLFCRMRSSAGVLSHFGSSLVCSFESAKAFIKFIVDYRGDGAWNHCYRKIE